MGGQTDISKPNIWPPFLYPSLALFTKNHDATPERWLVPNSVDGDGQLFLDLMLRPQIAETTS